MVALAVVQCVAVTGLTQLSASAVAAPTLPGGAFDKLAPARVLDTRSGVGAPTAAVAAHGSVTVALAGRNGVPSSGSPSVLLTLMASSPTAAGDVIAYRGGSTRPTTSSVTFAAGQTVSNSVVVQVGTGGVTFYNSSAGTVQLTADLAGYYASGAPTQAGMYGAVSPIRLLDTAHGVGAATGPLPAHGSVDVQLTGRGGVPASGAAVVLAELGVASPSAPGTLVAYPSGTARPDTTTVAFSAGRRAANLAAVRVSSAGRITVYNNSSAPVQLLGDVSGYFLTGTPSVTGSFYKVASGRLLDTRSGIGAPGTAVAAGASISVQATGRISIPSTGVTAVLVNVNAIIPTASGFLTVYPSGTTRPATEHVTFTSTHSSVGLVLVRVGSNGKISFYNGSAGTVQIAADIVGYVVHDFTWAAPTTAIAPVGQLTSVSCPSGTFCLAVDGFGNAVRYNGSTWGAPVSVGVGTQLASVSCASTTSCWAVSAQGTAAKFNGVTWSALSSIDSGRSLVSVSCPSSSFCAAVDSTGGAVRYNGTTWSARTTIDSGGELVQVSCSSGTFCAAVDRAGRAVRFTGAGWTAPASIDAGNGGFVSVSCPSSSFCVAFDLFGNVLTFTGTNWSAPDAQFFAGHVSCLSVSFCVAVDGSEAEVFNGSTWTLTHELTDDPARVLSAVSCVSSTDCVGIDSDSAYRYNGSLDWTSTPVEHIHSSLDSVSCSSASFCAATDDKSVSTFNGSSWSTPHLLGSDGPSDGGFPVTYRSTSLSCPSSSFCANTDTVDTFIVDGSTPSATLYNGSTWTNSPGFDKGKTMRPTSVSCVSASFCIAVGAQNAESLPTLNDYALRYNGSSWTATTLATSTHAPTSVSCPSTSLCVAVGDGGWYRFNGTTWSAFTTLDSGHRLVSVSCPSTTFCVAVDADGRALTYTGAVWSSPAPVDSSLAAVSCGSVGFCVAVDSAGNAVRYDGSLWSAPVNLIPGGTLTAVSCPTNSFCVAADNGGRVVVGTR